ncbi:hypothetical protein DPMN_187834 [Dreissena polymorpha]|uniref:Uncharacterized protein n=1 Tax=Dreissena polymorpha TaxID=45954 RepID=A0A9D4DRU1_DREPO|nr:hypothetical protein DPMN_187834 [Dreissena polymorpha]
MTRMKPFSQPVNTRQSQPPLPAALICRKKRKKNISNRLVVLEIQKAKAECDVLKNKKEAQGQKERVQAMRDQVALQREHLALKKERALINLQIGREKALNQTYIEKVTELNLLKEKLKIEKCNARKAQLEVQMLEAKSVSGHDNRRLQ